MKKIESDYIQEYGDIPKYPYERLEYLFKTSNLTRYPEPLISDKIHSIESIKWNKVAFTFFLLPKATPRPRHNIRTNTFYVVGAKDNKDIFKRFISKCDVDMITTPCKFKCVSYLPVPKSMNTIDRILAELGYIRPITKPDWDNLGKTYSDMIQGTLLFDDNLIIEGISQKYYSIKPRIEIEIKYMEKHDSLFNEKKIRKKVEKI
jgi:Holliday junction resolvase RusA-like endonuclease